MIHVLGKYNKGISWFLASLFYVELFLIPLTGNARGFTANSVPVRKTSVQWNVRGESLGKGIARETHTPTQVKSNSEHAKLPSQHAPGPTQPEMQAFSSVNSSNMVDLFSGDFSYNIPLMDVGGYPINIGYRSGISMDQEASWVGLGWNINPGTITRNLRGLPDDFNGSDSVKKTINIKENKTIGVTPDPGLEITGLPIGITPTLGVFHNNYKGWGLENTVNASIGAALGSKGVLSGGLSLTNNSQEGLTIAPSLSVSLSQKDADEKSGYTTSFSTSLPYNSRTGLKGLQLSAGIRQMQTDEKNQEHTYSAGGAISSVISFASPSYTPKIDIPFTSRQFSFTGKLGLAHKKVVDPNFFISGYVSKQRVDAKDTSLALPAYGYLHFQEGSKNINGLLDFNREKEMAYREKPATPHIAIPVYTYDAFSITGEGTGGMFRAYRGDIGFVNDPYMRTKDESDRISADLGLGDLVHGGVDLNINRAFTQQGPWLQENVLKNTIAFKDTGVLFEPVYFRNPGEKSINSKQFYETLGGDDVVSVDLYQANINSPFIQATNFLTRYRNKRPIDKTLLTPQNVVKPERDKRTQVITYLTAKEASVTGLSKYIENYHLNSFTLTSCVAGDPGEGPGSGLPGDYYNGQNFSIFRASRNDATINFNWVRNSPIPNVVDADFFSIRWKGRLRAPVTGQYTIYADSTDDRVRLWLNDSLLINEWHEVKSATGYTATVNLVEGEFYNIRIDYSDWKRDASLKIKWLHPNLSQKEVIPQQYLYGQPADVIPDAAFDKERRINSFRKENHLSEIDVLNNDGRRYVYGIPVYNLKQKEATFAVDGKNRANKNSGLVGYNPGVDNSTKNRQGKDWYFNSEEIPAYTHSFLLTAILSPDYVDATGNGISDDDLGDAVKFNYSKVCGIGNPYRWRAPYVTDSVSYNQGLKTDYRDDKGNYVYGEKELWYLHSIESKTMIATFEVEDRLDQAAIDESGNKLSNGNAKRLKQIKLYSKPDFFKDPVAAKPVKVVHFEYSYELCKGINKPSNDSGKLTLKKIWFSYNGNNKGKQNPYVFNYNPKNPDYNSKSFDRWGNYKEPIENPGSTTNNLIGNAEYPYALQDSSVAARNAAAWALDSISLPSGGSIKVTYESDDYAYVQNRRAMQLFKVLALGTSSNYASAGQKLYGDNDNLYVFVSVPHSVTSDLDVFRQYLAGIKKLYFRLSVKMPADQYGSGYEYVSCYADLDVANAYGFASANVIWIKLAGISLKGDGGGTYSPLAKAAIQFLKLNLPSKAFPGSEVGDNIDLANAVKVLASLKNNIVNAVNSFDQTSRTNSWASLIDTSRSFVRLCNPIYKKYGGGHRVKQITVYDNWDKMDSGARPAKYGQQYIYTTQKEIDGSLKTISSGVASYEPGIGGDENPFHEPIEYVEKVSALGPVTLGYSEEPLGESFFPSAGVGYSKVRVRTINYKNIKSANGYDETNFYTAYDFPTYTDRSLIDNDTRKRYKPSLSNFLRVNAKHYLTLSQGFKIELNDMHGKLRSQASYAETDPVNPITYTENIYRVENPNLESKRLSNLVYAIHPDGSIDTTALIGKDVELMVDMREQLSISNGYNINVNSDLFSVPFAPPVFLIPSFLNLAQREENQFRSVATVKIIQRYGILDSVIHIDKGSKVSTKDILYDAETGDALLTRTQNEFNDPIYNFSYPSHWAYEGMGLAYRNINVQLKHVNIRNGRITSTLPVTDSLLFASGDEIIVAGKLPTGGSNCSTPFSTFPAYDRIWAIDSNVLRGGPKVFYFLDKNGRPYDAVDVTIKIIRSGRKNINTATGSVTTLKNPLVKDVGTNQYSVVLTTNAKVVNATAGTFRQFWNVQDQFRKSSSVSCAQYQPQDCQQSGQSCTCLCLRKLFDYLIASKRLFIHMSDSITVSSIVQDAYAAGYLVTINDCQVLQQNANKLFYAMTFDSVSTNYTAHLGNCTVRFEASQAVRFYKIRSQNCNDHAYVTYLDTVSHGIVDTFNTSYYATKSVNRYRIQQDVEGLFPYTPPTWAKDTNSTKLIGGNRGIWTGHPPPMNDYTIDGYTKFDSIVNLPTSANIQQATLYLYADLTGFHPPQYTDAHYTGSGNQYSIAIPNDIWSYSTAPESFPFGATIYTYSVSNPFQDVTFDAVPFLNSWRSNGNTGLMVSNYTPLQAVSRTTYYSHRIGNVNKRPRIDVKYTLESSANDSIYATLFVESCQSCDTIVAKFCNSIVRDTSINPYATGVLGNWRSDKNYTYYGRRAESDPAAVTNIRSNGTFNDFIPFWSFQGNQLKPTTDTSRWVWNSQITMFNIKGFEIENKDPLGRFNAGLYGYNSTMPVAVVQNAHYRESAFDGFEDYSFSTQNCDTACATVRHFDFSSYKSKLSSLQKHTGKSSLKLNAGEQAAISVSIVTLQQDTVRPSLSFNTINLTCLMGALTDIRASNSILLPTFSPFIGKKMVLSAWVKEEQTCTCTSFTSNRIVVTFNGGSSVFLAPTGNIIEGWQRYESVFDIPSTGSTTMTVSLEATGSTAVYFDDLRIHPFNANMKSFVYNPVNLRLMAELDENNYSTFYEYDDDGTLIRVKKETERGVKTIKETRSALLKQ